MLRGWISGATQGVGQQRRLSPGRIGGSRGAAPLRTACRRADAPRSEQLLATSLRLLRRAPR